MIGIFKSPAEGCGGFVVLPDVTDQLSGEVGGRSEDSPSDDIALDFGKPDLDLIEPTRIGRGVMDPYGGIGLEELENILGFMCAQVVGDDVNLSALRLAGDDLVRKSTNSALVCRAVVLPMTSPVRVSSAAYSESVPGRKYSKPCRSALPGESGKTGSSRSSAWIALFSSTQNTAALSGGFRYKPMMSAAFSSNSGSSLATYPRTRCHARLTNAQLFGKPIAAPMGRTISGTLPRGLQDTRLGLGCPRSALTTAITRIESGQTLFLESASSTPGYTRHCNPVAAELPGKNDPRLTSK